MGCVFEVWGPKNLWRGPDPVLCSSVYFRALVNFTKSIDYSPRLDDVNSEEFQDVSKAVVDTVSGTSRVQSSGLVSLLSPTL